MKINTVKDLKENLPDILQSVDVPEYVRNNPAFKAIIDKIVNLNFEINYFSDDLDGVETCYMPGMIYFTWKTNRDKRCGFLIDCSRGDDLLCYVLNEKKGKTLERGRILDKMALAEIMVSGESYVSSGLINFDIFNVKLDNHICKKNHWNINAIKSSYLFDKKGDIEDLLVEPIKSRNILLDMLNSKTHTNPESIEDVISSIKHGVSIENGMKI